MTSYLRKAFLLPWKPNLQTVRCKNKVNIQRPALPHYKKALVIRLCQPIYNKPKLTHRPSVELCLKPTETKKKKDEERNIFAEILGKELFIDTKNSRFVGFLHTCPLSTEETFKVRVALMKHEGRMKKYGRRVAEIAWMNTYYEPALCLFKSHTSLVFSPDGSPQAVGDIMKIFRRVPALVLMAALVDDRMMDFNELERYSKLSDLTMERAKLASLLSVAGGGSLVQDLNSLQSTLVNQLAQRATQLQKSSSNGTDGDDRKLDETT